jgi:predicted lipid carrier protein YhbT
VQAASLTSVSFRLLMQRKPEMSPSDPIVWTGRALQAECDDLVLRFCIRPLNGAFVLQAIMDIRAPLRFGACAKLATIMKDCAHAVAAQFI